MNEINKHIVIIGAGPGGLTAGMLLSHKGFKVTLLEKDDTVGGRNQAIHKDGFIFDTGPTFLNLPFVVNDLFALVDKNIEDYLSMTMLDPLYRLAFHDKTVFITTDREKMREQIKTHFPGNEDGLDRFMKTEEQRFRALFPCLQKDYGSLASFMNMQLMKALPWVEAHHTLFSNLGRYFSDDDLKICFTFQSKYLGMSPWHCPALFTILSFMEHKYGVAHVHGGLNKISEAMASVIRENGGTINTGTAVKKLIIKNKAVTGVELESGDTIDCDDVFINADFAYAMENLVDQKHLKKYTSKKMAKKKYSCSTFMIYLGLKKIYDINHHNIYFAKSYQQNIIDIFDTKKLSDDISFYIQNASVTDNSLAPQGKSTMYILVPVPNNFSEIDWQAHKDAYFEKVIDTVIKRTGFTDLRQQIETTHVICPDDWEHSYNVYKAAEFNLAHTIPQMLYWRPHNKFEEFDHCYLVGGGTHPGSGLPTIYESARISTALLCKRYDIPFPPPPTLDTLIPS
ncbi:phytoene desaturase family protein [Candidatus Omnitrophota bacterium]